MWIKEKPISRYSQKCYQFLYPNNIDYVNLIHFEGYNDDHIYSLFYIGIDGKKYVSLENLSTVPRKGFCSLVDPSQERGGLYLCDDSVIIAAICRFIFSRYNAISAKKPKPGGSLLLLPRDLSRKFLAWHQIPHPVGEETAG